MYLGFASHPAGGLQQTPIAKFQYHPAQLVFGDGNQTYL